MSMTESEATKIIEGHIHFLGGNWKPHPDFDVIEALKEAIYALSKIQQYRAIGTVSEFRELKEKATAKKPIKRTDNDGYVDFYCPNCDAHLFFDDEQKFCNECGQAIVNDFKV